MPPGTWLKIRGTISLRGPVVTSSGGGGDKNLSTGNCVQDPVPVVPRQSPGHLGTVGTHYSPELLSCRDGNISAFSFSALRDFSFLSVCASES